ncbi:MAG: hypothetical protein AAGG08_09490, partial [Actinomycetota bacterium]
WLDAEYALLDIAVSTRSVADAEPGRMTVLSEPAPAQARFAIPQLLKDDSPGVLIVDELVFAEVDAGCALD